MTIINFSGLAIMFAVLWYMSPQRGNEPETPVESSRYQTGFCASGLEPLDTEAARSAGVVIHLRNASEDFAVSLIVGRVECEAEGLGCFRCETLVRTRDGREIPPLLQESCEVFRTLYDRALTEFPEEAVSRFEEEMLIGLAFMLFETTEQQTCNAIFFYDPAGVFPGLDPDDAL